MLDPTDVPHVLPGPTGDEERHVYKQWNDRRAQADDAIVSGAWHMARGNPDLALPYLARVLAAQGTGSAWTWWWQAFVSAAQSLPDADAIDLDDLAHDAPARAEVAASTTSRSALERLAADDDPDVRAAVARNPLVPRSVLHQLADDGSARVRYAAMIERHPSGGDELTAYDVGHEDGRHWLRSHDWRAGCTAAPCWACMNEPATRKDCRVCKGSGEGYDS